MSTNGKNTDVAGPETLETGEIIKARFHDLQNHLHLATMELELAELDRTRRVDCRKLLQILNAFRQSLQGLRDQLLAANKSEGQPQ